MRPINFITCWDPDQSMPVTEIFVNGLFVTSAIPKLNNEVFMSADGDRQAGYHEIVGDELRKGDKYGLGESEVEAILDFMSKTENFEKFIDYVPPQREEDVYIKVTY